MLLCKMITLIKILTILFATSLFFSCSPNLEKKDEVYCVIKHIKIEKPDYSGAEPPPPPPPPVTFYGDYNFILIDTFRVFYHTKHIYYSCMHGMDDSDPKPPKINLLPSDLIEIEINKLSEFLAGINDSITNERDFFASISSPTDTIKNRGFKIVRDFFKSRNLNRYIIRNCTEEEEYVVTAKINNLHYNPKTIDWKVGFDIEFTPPTN